MLKSYLKTAVRNLIKNKMHSFINIMGLSAGMAVAMLIGLWIYDEVSFEKYHSQYSNIVRVMDKSNVGGGQTTGTTLPFPLSGQLRTKYGNHFKQVAATITFDQNIAYGDKAFTKTGCYTEPSFTKIITLDMLKGSRESFDKPGTILINASLAKTMFGGADPINKLVKLSNNNSLQVTGVYKDMPANTQFSNINFIAGADLLFENKAATQNWYSSSFEVYALLNNNANLQSISSVIKNELYLNNQDATKPTLFLYPMAKWHLYEFKNGAEAAGRLKFVWLFGAIGIFVLLLACINFMNLSTARSEKRAKEVGIRKAVGSLRGQLIGQFLSESFVVVVLAFVISLFLVWVSLPLFNQVSGKQMSIVWNSPAAWLACVGFCVFTGLLAGSYPAIYLSSFQPVKVLKGTFRAGRFAGVTRRVLVVVQFTVSVILVISTLVVFKQIQFAKDRPIGYSRSNLVTLPYSFTSPQHYAAFRDAVQRTNAVDGMSAASNPTTGIWSSADNLDWKGKDPNRQELFGTVLVDPDFGNVVGWQMKEGRNFSKQYATDSACFLFNEAAIKQMGLKKPIGETIKWHGKSWTTIGVVKDMVMTSPFDPITPVVFLMDDRQRNFNSVVLKINGSMPAHEALAKVEAVFKQFVPATPFNFSFADADYAQKFAAEEQVGKLASVFAILAIFISCLGLFGMASFVAEQRTKEIGVRKVLGATVFNLWGLMSKEFVVLVAISMLIAAPTAWYFMDNWLQAYQYHTQIPWWIFALTGVASMVITLLTVSYQSIKAALMNPVKSLRSE